MKNIFMFEVGADAPTSGKAPKSGQKPPVETPPVETNTIFIPSTEETTVKTTFDQVLMKTKLNEKAEVIGITVLEVLRKGVKISKSEADQINSVVPQKDRGIHKFLIDSVHGIKEGNYKAEEIGVFPNSVLAIKF
jgi:hypothetical protein